MFISTAPSKALENQQWPNLIIPQKGLIHIWPANRFVNPHAGPRSWSIANLAVFFPTKRGRTHNGSSAHIGFTDRSVGTCVNRPLSEDDEVGLLLRKEGDNAEEQKRNPRKQKSKEIPKDKERKDRERFKTGSIPQTIGGCFLGRVCTKRVVRQHALLRRVLRRFLRLPSRVFQEGFSEGILRCLERGSS